MQNFSDVFTAKAFAMYWTKYLEQANTEGYLGTSLFPPVKKKGIDIKWIKGRSGLPVTLRQSAFDAVAHVRDRIGVTAIQTEMPFFRDSFIVKESDRQEILRAQDSNDPYVQPVLDNIYNDAKNLTNGANVVPERMIMQLLSPADGSPKIEISDGAKVSCLYEYDVDGSFKTNNFKALTGTAAWTDHKNSNPVQDILDAKEVVERTGNVPTIALMSKKTLRDIRENENVKAYIVAKAQATGGVILVTDKLVKEYISEETELTVVVNNKSFIDESGTAKRFYPDDMVTLLPAQPLGSTVYGTSPEEADLMADDKADVAIVNTGVAIATIKQEHPVNVRVLASEIVLPSFEGMDNVYVINTNAKIGELTVNSVAGTSASGKTKVTVSPSLSAGNSYKYKTASSVTVPEFGAECKSGYTAWDGVSEITATTGNKILIVEVDANNKAVKAGSATVASKA
ncbi:MULTISPECIES: major capsid protein [Ruminococcus]|uniref:Major capsid protein n=1 Tax=Ruminococcus bicirculans (ex Wegman et al. 2014) TaxID=1160721 RepID=A0AAW6E339_9FIRM|nr:major capsid protein [Ruminococcus bicirculans (ex Wegman et al. 2014)]MDB8736954.1 major capsid protein [Ruminococcus bicirculans (ex Wegman et al. 2014)]MDB8742850.1 major capsid protein [Ruminococcus bicirculans (ex Wegman et al. 2014)]